MDHQTSRGGRFLPGWIVLAGLAAVALIALGVPLASLLYVGVLLLCPLLMVGMHGHGHGSDGAREANHVHTSAGSPSGPTHLEKPRGTEAENRS